MGLITITALGIRIMNMKNTYYWKENENFLQALNLYNNGYTNGVSDLLDKAQKEMRKKGFVARMLS